MYPPQPPGGAPPPGYPQQPQGGYPAPNQSWGPQQSGGGGAGWGQAPQGAPAYGQQQQAPQGYPPSSGQPPYGQAPQGLPPGAAPAYQQPGYQQPGYQQPGYQQPQPDMGGGYGGGYNNNYPMPVGTRNNGLAVAAIRLCMLGPVSIVLGFIALDQCKKDHSYGNSWMAVAGMAGGAVFTIIYTIATIFILSHMR